MGLELGAASWEALLSNRLGNLRGSGEALGNPRGERAGDEQAGVPQRKCPALPPSSREPPGELKGPASAGSGQESNPPKCLSALPAEHSYASWLWGPGVSSAPPHWPGLSWDSRPPRLQSKIGETFALFGGNPVARASGKAICWSGLAGTKGTASTGEVTGSYLAT